MGAFQGIAKKTRTDVTIEKFMFELVLVASEAPIAGPIAVLRARLQQRKRPLEQRQTEVRKPATKSSSSGPRVLQVDLSFETFAPSVGQRWSILCLQFIRLELKNLAACLRKRFTDCTERNVGSEDTWCQLEGQLDTDGHE